MTNTEKTVALVVGGSSGMGKDIAKRLLTGGTAVMVLARDAKRLAEARLELEPLGAVEIVEVDLFDEAAVKLLIAQLDGEPRHIKYLVNSAGSFKPTAFLDHTEADYDQYADVNRSVFFITQAVARNMKRHGGGSIVNLGSMWAQQAIKATHPFLRVFDGESRVALPDPASGDGASRVGHSRERRLTRRGGHAHLWRVY